MDMAKVEVVAAVEVFDVEAGSRAGVRGGKYSGRRSGGMKRSYIVTMFAIFSAGILCPPVL